MLKIRRYKTEDHDAIWELHNIALHSVGAHAGNGPWDDDLNQIETVYLSGRGEFLVGEYDGRIVAMGALKQTKDDRGEIKRMRVHPECQRRGFGQAILADLERRARELGYQVLHLDTTVQQTAARRLYEKNGYSVIGEGDIQDFHCLFYEKRVEAGWDEMECRSSLPNRENSWERPKQTHALDRTEIERRIGSVSEPLEVLSGGLANLNVRIGADRVLRIYRRDPGVVGKESALLRFGWKSFRVPGVLMSGEDFLLMEYIAHKPIDADAVHGAAAGQALAEIHRVSYSQAGELNAQLAVCRPFGDVIDAFREYALSELEKLEPALGQGLRPSLVAFLEKHKSELRALSGSPVMLHGDFKASNLHWTDRGEFLVFDWEFAYAGPRLMDIGQLVRWEPPACFIEAFASAYSDCGQALPKDWQKWAGAFDLFNLIGLLAGVPLDSRRAIDVRHRIEQIMAEFD